jgi:hypothetical protein
MNVYLSEPWKRQVFSSDIQEDRGLVGEDLLFNANNWSIHGVVNVREICLSRTLSNSSEFIVHGTVAKANPTLISSQIGNGDATQMSANSRAHENVGVSGIRKGSY